jgi:membrane protease YdiL (CAAX protease family)
VKGYVGTIIAFGIGFYLYWAVNSYWILSQNTDELHMLLNRFSLIVIIIPLLMQSLIHKIPFIRNWRKPQWDAVVGVPLIWSGFRQTKLKYFLLIAILINFVSFLPFILHQGWTHVQAVWVYALIFAVANISEEIIWRGTLLSRLTEHFGEKWAVVLTSVGFGLQHYTLGFSWAICLAYAIGGLFFGGITIKAKSIFPAVIWHMAINVFMILSGFL